MSETSANRAPSFELAGRKVGSGEPCLIIAEAGVNHNGDMSLARELVERAVDCGADAVKFQSYITEEIVTGAARQAEYQRRTSATATGTQFDMLKRLELSRDQQGMIAEYCETSGIIFLSTPYDFKSADGLDELGVAAFKVASTDTTNLPFLRHLGKKGRPVILSTGMCDLEEVRRAVGALEETLSREQLCMLHCTSEYPAPIREANLSAMATLAQAFGWVVGFSDHTEGTEVASWAVAAGARIIEKHFTLDRGMDGPDHAASVEPEEFARLVESVRMVEECLGDGEKKVAPSEMANKRVMQKSLVAVVDIPVGETITERMIGIKRPGTGLPPGMFDRVVGCKVVRAVASDELLTRENVELGIQGENE